MEARFDRLDPEAPYAEESFMVPADHGLPFNSAFTFQIKGYPMTNYEMWTHGVDVQIEYPDRIISIGSDERADARRSGWGTLVFQGAGAQFNVE